MSFFPAIALELQGLDLVLSEKVITLVSLLSVLTSSAVVMSQVSSSNNIGPPRPRQFSNSWCAYKLNFLKSFVEVPSGKKSYLKTATAMTKTTQKKSGPIPCKCCTSLDHSSEGQMTTTIVASYIVPHSRLLTT